MNIFTKAIALVFVVAASGLVGCVSTPQGPKPLDNEKAFDSRCPNVKIGTNESGKLVIRVTTPDSVRFEKLAQVYVMQGNVQGADVAMRMAQASSVYEARDYCTQRYYYKNPAYMP